MMNGITSVGINNQNYQIAFRAKGVNKQETMKIVDKLKIKDLFTGKVVKPEETKPEQINAAIETANNASRAVYLEQLRRKSDPELYKEVLRRDAEHKVAQMSNVELIKEFIKGFFKK